MTDSGFEELSTLDDMNGVRSVAFSPDGKLLATGADGQPIWVYDFDGKKPKERTTFKPMGAGSAANFLAFLPDSKGLAFGYQGGRGNVGVQDVWSKESRTLDGTATIDAVHRGALSRDGKLLAAFGKTSDRKDGGIHLFDVEAGRLTPRKELRKHTRQGQGLSFSADGAYLASSGKDSQWAVWRVSDGALLISKLRAGDINDVNINPVAPKGGDLQLAHTTHGRDVHLITLKRVK
jgi:WD40 repeat protein